MSTDRLPNELSAEPTSEATESAHRSRTFEAGLRDLQQIAQALEGGGLGLEESLREFERGIGLLRQSYRLLEGAEQRVDQLLAVTAGGEETAALDATATATQLRGRGAARRTSSTKRSPKPELKFDDPIATEVDRLDGLDLEPPTGSKVP